MLQDLRKPQKQKASLTREELLHRLLWPLKTKGKLGREHTTPIEHLYGHGIPDHQKHEARALCEQFIQEGILLEKRSQGRRQVWLSKSGLGKLLILPQNQ